MSGGGGKSLGTQTNGAVKVAPTNKYTRLCTKRVDTQLFVCLVGGCGCDRCWCMTRVSKWKIVKKMRG